MKTLLMLCLMAVVSADSVAGILATPTSATLADVQFQATSSTETLTLNQTRIQEIITAMVTNKGGGKTIWTEIKKPGCGGFLIGTLARKSKDTSNPATPEWKILYDTNIDCLFVLDCKSGQQFADYGCSGIISHAAISEKVFYTSFFAGPETWKEFELNRECWQGRFDTVLADIVRALKL